MKDSFYTNVLKMFMGTTGAYIFWALAMLIVGRLYTPEYFGGGQLFISAASMLSVVATGRYEKALMLPQFRPRAMQILLFSVILSVSCTAGVFLVLVCSPSFFVGLTGIAAENILFLPFYTLELCVYVLFYAWMVRTKQYAAAARGLVLFPVSYLVFCVALYPVEMHWHKLILALILARGVEILYFGLYLYWDMKADARRISMQEAMDAGREYADFPKYVLTGSFVEEAAVQVVPFLVSAFWGLEATGYYAMAMQVLAAPMGLIAKAVRDVFMQEGARLYAKYKECKAFYRKNLRLCLMYSLIVCSAVYIFVPILLPLVLGEKWNVAGQYVRWMVPMEIGMLVSTPLLDMYSIARRQKKYLLMQAAFLGSSVLGIGVAGKLEGSIEAALLGWGMLSIFVSCASVYGGWKIATGVTR